MEYTTSGIICFDPYTKRFLVMRARFNGRRWSLPKGYINKGETPLQAAIRELYEETSIQIKEKDVLDTTYDIELKLDKPTKKIPSGIKYIKFYIAYIDSAHTDIKLSKEHIEYRWLSHLHVLKGIPHEFVSLCYSILNHHESSTNSVEIL